MHLVAVWLSWVQMERRLCNEILLHWHSDVFHTRTRRWSAYSRRTRSSPDIHSKTTCIKKRGLIYY